MFQQGNTDIIIRTQHFQQCCVYAGFITMRPQRKGGFNTGAFQNYRNKNKRSKVRFALVFWCPRQGSYGQKEHVCAAFLLG